MSNPGRTSIGRQAKSLEISTQFNGYSRVTINVTDKLYYTSGTDTGRELVIDCPWGTQAMANNLRSSLSGFQYQPYEAKQAIIDPAAELGDGVTVNGVYGGLFRIQTKAGALHAADISAPEDKEIDHEYKYTPSTTRKIERQIATVHSELIVAANEIRGEVADDVNEINGQLSIQADKISAKVDQTGGSSSTFGWQLLATGFLLKSGNNTVFQCNSSGVQITGKVTATSGYIGNGSQGFLIGNKSISNGKSSLSDSNNGIYIGTDGIALGTKFKVDSQGNLTASSGTFTGAVYANQVQAGGNAGYITTGQMGSRSITAAKCSSGINSSLANADYAADVFAGSVRANYGKFSQLDMNYVKFTGKPLSLVSYTNLTSAYKVLCTNA